MKRLVFIVLASWAVLFGSVTVSQAQTNPSVPSYPASVQGSSSPSPAVQPTPKPKENFFKDIVHDQKAIWLSPFHLNRSDAKWLIPFTATTAGLLLTDKDTSAWVSRNGSLPGDSHAVSYGGSVYATAGFSGAMYLIGHSGHYERLEQTGRLSLEALIDVFPVVELSKTVFGRERPNTASGGGHFFNGGRSFPSGHATSAWAVATVVAYEYKKRPLIKYGAFAIAAAISLSRYTGRNHFLGDVFVGSCSASASGDTFIPLITDQFERTVHSNISRSYHQPNNS